MPRVVDHEQRRRELPDALRRVVLREGVERASVRLVAAEAGWSSGALRHYFSTQDELVRFAVSRVLVETPQRIERLLALDPPPDDLAHRLLDELLPLDDRRRAEAMVWLAFLDRTRVDGSFTDMLALAWEGTRRLARLAVAHLRRLDPPSGTETPLPDADEQLAVRLHVLVDGLTLQCVRYGDRLSPQQARAHLHAELDAIRERA